MCGIAGAIYFPELEPSGTESQLIEALDSISHRGPDNAGVYTFENLLLGHVRLSILDLTSQGNQPMCSRSKRYVISYNGEVYNFKQLANKYKLTDLVSSSDTEVILELIELLGIKVIEEFNGMFAFSIVDLQEKKLWLVRDRLGIKPLYLNKTNEGIFFASEMKAIKIIAENRAFELNDSKVHEWLYYGSPLGKETLYKGVETLLPGHYVEINLDSLDVKETCYWKPSLPTNKLVNIDMLIVKNTELLEQAVCRQLVSDVPVGVFLSGGIDSSAITAFASRNYDKRLSTYSVGFDFDKGVNELPKAKALAKKFNTDHHELHISGFDVADVVEKMVHHHDHPFSDAANIPLYLLCESVKDNTKVVLQGDGGDELYGGYKRYNTLGNISKMRLLAKVGGFANQFSHKNKAYWVRQRYINALLAPSEAEMMALLLTVEDKKHSPLQVFSSSFINRISKYDPFIRYRECQSRLAGSPLSDQMALIDSMIILPDIFLEKVDRSTMAASVEVRVPFLDNDLVQFAQSIPNKIKTPGGHQKWLLKKSLDGIIPNEILYGKKTGFGVPFAFWVTNALSSLLFDNLQSFNDRNPNVFDIKQVKRLYEMQKAGTGNYGFLLWKVLNFVLWANKNRIEIKV